MKAWRSRLGPGNQRAHGPLEHPCQALADYFTLQNHFGDFKNLCLAYVGDGNNVAHSLLLTCACLGSNIRIATPAGYESNPEIVRDAQDVARQTGAKIELLEIRTKLSQGPTPSIPTHGRAWGRRMKSKREPGCSHPTN